MSRVHRVLIEVGLPPPVAAVLLVATSPRPYGLSDVLIGFPVLVATAYGLAFVPCVAYAAAMEFWFAGGMRERSGWVCTAGISSLLGLAVGCLIDWLIQGGGKALLLIGAADGLLVGAYLAYRYRPS